MRNIKRNIKEKPILFIVAITLVFTGVLVCRISLPHWITWNRLNRMGIIANAVITEKSSENAITYQFEVSQADAQIVIYERKINVSYRLHNELEVNKSIDVKYIPNNPKISDIASREDENYFNYVFTGFGFIVSGFIWFILFIVAGLKYELTVWGARAR